MAVQQMDRKAIVKFYTELFCIAYQKRVPDQSIEKFVVRVMDRLKCYAPKLTDNNGLFLLLLVMFEYFQLLPVATKLVYPVSNKPYHPDNINVDLIVEVV